MSDINIRTCIIVSLVSWGLENTNYILGGGGGGAV